MRKTQLFVSVVFALSLAACGGDDGGSPQIVDAPQQQIDAPMIDAGNPPAMGLGARCDQSTPCPTTPAGLECIALSQGATYGFCALPCGMTAAGAQQPPAGGTMICTNSQPAPGNGTPVCAITGPAANNMTPWYCGVACGTFQGMNLGSCPGGLVCTDNLCQ